MKVQWLFGRANPAERSQTERAAVLSLVGCGDKRAVRVINPDGLTTAERRLPLPDVDEERAVRVANAIRMLVTRLRIYHPRSPRKYVTISLGVAGRVRRQPTSWRSPVMPISRCTTRRSRDGTPRSPVPPWRPPVWSWPRWRRRRPTWSRPPDDPRKRRAQAVFRAPPSSRHVGDRPHLAKHHPRCLTAEPS